MGRILLFIAGAGAIGGLLNAGLSDSGLMLPEVVNLPGRDAVLPGFLGNVFVGAVAALLSFGLYGPLSGAALFRASGAGGQQPVPAPTPAPTTNQSGEPSKPPDQQPVPAPTPAPTPVSTPMTLAALAGAMLVGFSGGRLVTTEADRQLNRATAEVTAGAAEKALQVAETQRPQAETKPPGQLPLGVHQFNRVEAEPTPGAAAPAPQAAVTTPKQPFSACLQTIRTSPPLESYRMAMEFQRMVNSPADGH